MHEASSGTVSLGHQDAAEALLDALRPGQVRPRLVADLLDRMTAAERQAAVRATGRREQRALWDAVDGFAPLGLADIVPPSVANNTAVRHIGKNSLPLFTRFEKRFVRPAPEANDGRHELHGYNWQESGLATSFTGPGYFVAVEDVQRREVLIDYHRVPRVQPSGWPRVRNNEGGGARLVYGFMIDTLRRVSEHVTIGHANKHGKDMNAWFILCREGE